MTQQDIDREWAKMFLTNWNKTVKLWDDGFLFSDEGSHSETPIEQREYARICVAWLIPNGFQEPHCVAQGE